MAKKELSIKTSIKYNDLRNYKRKFQEGEIFDVKFQLFLDGISFPALVKYGLVARRLRYDRQHKFKIYFDGFAKKARDIKLIEKLYDRQPSKTILIGEILFAKEKQELIRRENGNLEYHFTFLQY